jgi:hypothetical protein
MKKTEYSYFATRYALARYLRAFVIVTVVTFVGFVLSGFADFDSIGWLPHSLDLVNCAGWVCYVSALLFAAKTHREVEAFFVHGVSPFRLAFPVSVAVAVLIVAAGVMHGNNSLSLVLFAVTVSCGLLIWLCLAHRREYKLMEFGFLAQVLLAGLYILQYQVVWDEASHIPYATTALMVSCAIVFSHLVNRNPTISPALKFDSDLRQGIKKSPDLQKVSERGEKEAQSSDTVASMPDRGLSFGAKQRESTSPKYSESVNIRPVEGKLRILFLAANPNDQTQLKLGEEYRDVLSLIRASDFRDRIELTMRLALRHSDLAQALMEEQPHIVHFSGHGSNRDELILQDDHGKSHYVTRKAISALFKTLKDDIRLVVFNACFSKPQAEGIVENIAFAVGMNQAIGDNAAMSFAAGFYRGIGFGRSMQESFDLGKSALQLAGIGQELIPQLLNHPMADPTKVCLVNKIGVPVEKQQANDVSMTSGAVRLWMEKLSALLEAEALEDDPTRRLRYKKQIDECRQKISELSASP